MSNQPTSTDSTPRAPWYRKYQTIFFTCLIVACMIFPSLLLFPAVFVALNVGFWVADRIKMRKSKEAPTEAITSDELKELIRDVQAINAKAQKDRPSPSTEEPIQFSEQQERAINMAVNVGR